ncbi:hypothetical protein [Granulicoccus sp. GXG6511]|uniref:hypothetical protein n=1 Tax=Granulicoccus sp. GXG6511 TaxID=3381351 RepID=UPI003D7D4CD7
MSAAAAPRFSVSHWVLHLLVGLSGFLGLVIFFIRQRVQAPFAPHLGPFAPPAAPTVGELLAIPQEYLVMLVPWCLAPAVAALLHRRRPTLLSVGVAVLAGYATWWLLEVSASPRPPGDFWHLTAVFTMLIGFGALPAALLALVVDAAQRSWRAAHIAIVLAIVEAVALGAALVVPAHQ